ncbi:MAG: DegT/DnrJ/EryC1/StrS aminotransferase family protein, partial [Chitinophagaceae bacterium]|nr:DegT/DnrJ/EryC1/StrS aminotransferase family protein [Chitinophagaceae bacterium]
MNNSFIPISKPSITDKEIAYVTDAVSSTWISSLGKYIDRFETEFASFCGTRYGVATSNGTVALHLALVALGIGKGDEVIVPDLSFVATVNTILQAGAVPVFADIDPYNLCMDPRELEKVITSRTKAIMPVHLYGHPADMNAINAIAEKHNLLVIEDAAEAHGASIHGRKVGNWGVCGSFSFYGNKNITTGEGGMITTNDEALYNRLRHLRDHAMSKEKRYWHTECGYNYRMTNLQAALGCAQLERIDALMERKRQIFKIYS